MIKKYVVFNTLTGYVCNNGKGFLTKRGAIKFIVRSPFGSFMELRKYV